MKRAQLEHLIRAVAAIANVKRMLIIGSQSILGAYPDAPEELLVSMEADIVPYDNPALADLIDGTIGEDSPFHETFGYYAQGVSPDTAVLPRGWEGRLVRVETANTGDAAGLCLDPHDLALSKYAAGREKDLLFVAALVRHRMLDRNTTLARLAMMPLAQEAIERIEARIRRDFADAEGTR